MTPQEVVRLLSALTLASNLGVVLFLALLLLRNLFIFKDYWKRTLRFFTSRALFFSFLVTLTATSGSLYFSEVAGFAPCILCWYQRIFMYPLVLILGVSLWRKKPASGRQDVWQYVLPLSIIGLIIALYHYKEQISPSTYLPCTSVGFSASCSERFFTHFGYITIPWMAFSAFLLITIGMLLLRYKRS